MLDSSVVPRTHTGRCPPFSHHWLVLHRSMVLATVQATVAVDMSAIVLQGIQSVTNVASSYSPLVTPPEWIRTVNAAERLTGVAGLECRRALVSTARVEKIGL